MPYRYPVLLGCVPPVMPLQNSMASKVYQVLWHVHHYKSVLETLLPVNALVCLEAKPGGGSELDTERGDFVGSRPFPCARLLLVTPSPTQL